MAVPRIAARRTTLAALAILTFVLALPRRLAAQQEGPPVTIGTTWTLHSRVLDEDRRLLVHLPTGYATSGERYPVMYLLDGDAHFEHVSGIVDFLASNWRIPPMIVVGVTNTDRTRDLTPPTDRDTVRLKPPFFSDSLTLSFPTAGGADDFLRFLADEVVPLVEARYRTAPFRVLVGHSFGGLFAVHTLLSRPESFRAYIAISPTIWWNDEGPVKTAERKLADLPVDGRFLYLTVGDREGRMMSGLFDFSAALERAAPAGLRWWYRVMSDETHGSNPHLSVYDGLEAIFRDWRVPESLIIPGDIAALESHFARASKVYGYEIGPPEGLVNQMGYLQLQGGRSEKAIEIFRRNVELYPASANVHDSLADALEADGQLEAALAQREEAVHRASAEHDPRLDAFRRNRDALKRKIEKGSG